MWMDRGQIVREYRTAKNKGMQIKILAQLNGCTDTEIKNILIEEGEMNMPRAKAVKPVEEEKKAVEKAAVPVVEAKKEAKKQHIPDAVIKCVEDRMQHLDETIKRCEEEYKDLAVFIKEGVVVNE